MLLHTIIAVNLFIVAIINNAKSTFQAFSLFLLERHFYTVKNEKEFEIDSKSEEIRPNKYDNRSSKNSYVNWLGLDSRSLIRDYNL